MGLLTNPMVNRLIVEIPVRHGKSVYCSHLLPCWRLLTQPDKNVWVVTYGSNFAEEFGSRNLDLVRQQGERLTGMRLHPEFARRAHFRAAPPYVGEFRGLGILGPLAGKGAHLIICDDLIKEFSEVVTEEARDRIWMRFHGEVLNRLEPGGKIMVIMSRRHPDDLSGRLLASNAQQAPRDQWHEIKFPAISDDGKALWPERYPIEELLSIKRTLEIDGTPWVWSGLYQQEAGAASELCEWPASYWKEPFFYTEEQKPKFTPRFKLISLDPSKGKDARAGDFTALLYGEIDPDGTLWIDDPILVRVPVTQVEDLTVAMIRQRRPDAVAIEVNGFQEYVAQGIYNKAGPSCPIYPYENMRNQEQTVSAGPGKGKEVDIRMLLTPRLSRHQLRIRDTPQGQILAQQLRDFPLASHDDGPDALCQMERLYRDLLHGAGSRGARDEPILTG